MSNTRLTIYEIGEGEYIFREALRLRLNQELQKLDGSLDHEDFKRGYRQSLEIVKHWIDDGPRVEADG